MDEQGLLYVDIDVKLSTIRVRSNNTSPTIG